MQNRIIGVEEMAISSFHDQRRRLEIFFFETKSNFTPGICIPMNCFLATIIIALVWPAPCIKFYSCRNLSLIGTVVCFSLFVAVNECTLLVVCISLLVAVNEYTLSFFGPMPEKNPWFLLRPTRPETLFGILDKIPMKSAGEPEVAPNTLCT